MRTKHHGEVPILRTAHLGTDITQSKDNVRWLEKASDASTLWRLFTRNLGITPAEYRTRFTALSDSGYHQDPHSDSRKS